MAYVFAAALYLLVALVMALDASLVNFELLPYFSGIRWLRIHFITLATLTQVLFGALPLVVAQARGLPRPEMRWDIWASLNVGIVLLAVGIPPINSALIITGGTLVFVATLLLIGQIARVGSESEVAPSEPSGKAFFISGLSYFTLGIIVGTGLWNGWMPVLHVETPLEVHIHANNWGLFSLVFAGLLISMHKTWTGRPFPRPEALRYIFWLLNAGAFGLIFGPWFGSTWLLVPGLAAHLVGVVWLLRLFIGSQVRSKDRWTPGITHLMVSYVWIIAPVLAAPLILFSIVDLPQADIEALAPQALVYGWALQFGVAVVPYFLAKLMRPNAPAQLGGTWVSLALLNVGSAALWLAVFAEPTRALWSGMAYLLWALALVPVVGQVFRILRTTPDLEPARSEVGAA